jgi:hypothetical protein
MSKETLVFIIGALVFFSPFSGLPRDYKEWFLILAGILLMIIGYRLRRLAFLRSIDTGNGERRTELFVENNSDVEEENVGPILEEKMHV